MIGYIVFHIFCVFYTIGVNSYEVSTGGDTQSTWEIVWSVILAPIAVAFHIGMVMAKLDKK